MAAKTVLCLGSQGFIGSYICKDLLENGYYVIGLDNYSKYGPVSRGHDNHPNFLFINTNLESYDSWLLSFFRNNKIDFIIHGAAKIGGISYFHKYAYDLVSSNERITDNVISSFN